MLWIDTGKQSLSQTFRDLDAIAKLAPHDIAYVKRSTGEWRTAVVIEKSDAVGDMYIKFLLDAKGHTKTIPATKWMNLIRLLENPIHRSTNPKRQAHKSSNSCDGIDLFSSIKAVAPRGADTKQAHYLWYEMDPISYSTKEVSTQGSNKATITQEVLDSLTSLFPQDDPIPCEKSSSGDTKTEELDWRQLHEDVIGFEDPKSTSFQASDPNPKRSYSDPLPSWFGLFEDVNPKTSHRPKGSHKGSAPSSNMTALDSSSSYGMLLKESFMSEDKEKTKPKSTQFKRMGLRAEDNEKTKSISSQFKRSTSNDSHQRAFLSALAHIDHRRSKSLSDSVSSDYW